VSVSQPESFRRITRHSGSIVANFEEQRFTATSACELNETWANVRRDSVPNRIFDQRLQDQARDLRIQRLRIDLEDHLQPIAKTDALNF
jgi:hypothetical protein